MIINLSDLMEEYGADFYNGGWVKKLEKIDDTKSKGFKYVGDFVQKASLRGLYEFDPGYYIVCSIGGSRRHRENYVWLVKIDENGLQMLHKHPAVGEDWALQLLPLAKKLLDENAIVNQNPLAKFSDDELLQEVSRRKLSELLISNH